MKQEDLIKSCSELLYKLCDDVERLNSLNCYDINIASEYFFVPLINILFNCDMQNINSEKKNAKAIDLYDINGKLAVQVTSDCTADKIHKTLLKYRESKLYNQYDRLLFLVIVKKHNYTADFTADTKGLFAFDKKNDIFTIDHLIKHIENLDIYKIETIQKYLKFQIDPVTYYSQIITIHQDFERIKDNTNGKLNENYFEIDDESFITDFTKKLNGQNVIYISTLSLEEGRYCVLNLIHKLKPDTPIYIILSKECWEIADKFFSGCIIIPNFTRDEIPALKKNTTIFIQPIENRNEDSLVLHCRTWSFLARKLQENGCIDSYKILEQTQGIYYYVKKELYNGNMELPNWSKDKDKSLIVADLIGKWTECDGDKEVIESIYVECYNTFISYLCKYIGIEKPFLLRKQDWYNKTIFELTDHFLAIQAHRLSFDKSVYDSFYNIAKTVLCDKDPIFDLSDKERLFSAKSVHSRYSGLLKQGILQTLILLAVYCDQQPEVDKCMGFVLANIKSVNDWAYFSQYFDSICEASPKVAIKRLEEALKNDTGLIEMFSAETSTFIVGKHNYTRFLWALEQLLSSKDYVVRTVKILLELGNKIENCYMGNNPREDLEKVFCHWYNVSALKKNEKVELAGWAVKKYPYFWNLLFNDIATDSRLIINNSSFSYRKESPIIQYTEDDAQYLKIEYARILVSIAETDFEKIIKLLDILPYVPNDIYLILRTQINKVLSDCCDCNKERIKTQLRVLIYNIKRHSNCPVTNGFLKRLSELEELCLSIKFEDETYDYLYLVDSYNIPILNPVPYDKEDKTNIERNNEVRSIVLREEFQRMKASNVDFDHYLSIIDLKPYNTFGQKIAKYYSLSLFDEKVLDSLINATNNVTTVVHYVLACNDSDNNLVYNTIEYLRIKHFGDDFYLGLLLSLPFNDKTIHYIEELSEESNAKYWSKFPAYKLEDVKLASYVLENLLKNHCLDHMLAFLSDNVQLFCAKDIINILDESCHDSCNFNDYAIFNIQSILSYIYQRIGKSFESYEQLMSIEFRLFGNIQWDDMKCAQYFFKKDASFYAYVIKLSCKKDDGTYYLDTSQSEYRYYFDLERKMTFCPGEENGSINITILTEWLHSFNKQLEIQQQSGLYTKKLGKLFSCSPRGDDGFYPHEHIRDIIEKMDDDSIINAFVSSIINGRGCCNMTWGADEYKLSQKYKEIATHLQISYPQTAKIFFSLSEYYLKESNHERKLAENGIY